MYYVLIFFKDIFVVCMKIYENWFTKKQARLLTAKERMEKTGGTVHEIIKVNDE